MGVAFSFLRGRAQLGLHQGTEVPSVLRGGRGTSPAVSDAFFLAGELDTPASRGPSIQRTLWLHTPHPSTHSGPSGLPFLLEKTHLRSSGEDSRGGCI